MGLAEWFRPSSRKKKKKTFQRPLSASAPRVPSTRTHLAQSRAPRAPRRRRRGRSLGRRRFTGLDATLPPPPSSLPSAPPPPTPLLPRRSGQAQNGRRGPVASIEDGPARAPPPPSPPTRTRPYISAAVVSAVTAVLVCGLGSLFSPSRNRGLRPGAQGRDGSGAGRYARRTTQARGVRLGRRALGASRAPTNQRKTTKN